MSYLYSRYLREGAGAGKSCRAGMWEPEELREAQIMPEEDAAEDGREPESRAAEAERVDREPAQETAADISTADPVPEPVAAEETAAQDRVPAVPDHMVFPEQLPWNSMEEAMKGMPQNPWSWDRRDDDRRDRNRGDDNRRDRDRRDDDWRGGDRRDDDRRGWDGRDRGRDRDRRDDREGRGRRDQEFFRGLFPRRIRRMWDYVREELDRMGQRSGMMVDEYPDRVRMDQARDRILRRMEADSVPEVLEQPDYSRDVVETLLYQEMMERRNRQDTGT